MQCPRCGFEQPPGIECARCGIVFAKWQARQQPASPAPSVESAPVEERPARGRASWLLRPSRGSVRDMCTSLARLLDAGIPIIEALRNLAGGAGKRLRRALDDVASAITGGLGLGDAVSRHPDVFRRSDMQLIRAAEQTGDIALALRVIAQSLDSWIGVRRRLTKAAMYPLLVLVSSILIMPIPTLVLGSAADYFGGVTVNLLIVAAVIFALLVGVPWVWSNTPVGTFMKRACWRLPWPCTLYVAQIRAAFARNLAHNLAAGLPLFESLRAAAAVPGDRVAVERIETVCGRLEAGEELSDPLSVSGLVAPNDQMVLMSGERSGALVESLEALADNRSDQFVRGLNTLLVVLGTLMTVAVFAYVALRIVDAYSSLAAGVDGGLNDAMELIERELPYVR